MRIDIKDFQKNMDGQVVLDISFLSVESGGIVATSGPLERGKEVLWEKMTRRTRLIADRVRLIDSKPCQILNL